MAQKPDSPATATRNPMRAPTFVPMMRNTLPGKTMMAARTMTIPRTWGSHENSASSDATVARPTATATARRR